MSDPTLQLIYETRPDLQAAFDVETGQAIDGSRAGFLLDLEDWARQYGWREYSGLSAYAPAVIPEPTHVSVPPVVTASAFIVLDRKSGLILAERGSANPWPIASLTKLMTAHLVLQSGAPFDSVRAINQDDEVGGARLWVDPGATFTLSDLMYATLVGSANNAANALAEAAESDRAAFVEDMNAAAAAWHLAHTHFADPTGIELENVSTAREIAALAAHVFENRDMRRFTSTALRYISVLSTGEQKKIQNTNWMLWRPEYDDIFVMSGKTGYLEESGWNLVVSLRPTLADETRELMVVTFGSRSRAESFQDAEALARWTWENYHWIQNS